MRAAIRYWMQKRGIHNLKELARLSGLNYSTLSRHMREGGLTELEICSVAEVLGLVPALVERS